MPSNRVGWGILSTSNFALKTFVPALFRSESAEVVAEARRDQLVMESFIYRFHPQWAKTRELVAQGLIGELHSVRTEFSFFNEDPVDIRNRHETGGGGLLDIGCYAVSVSRWLFGAEPRRAFAALEIDPRFGTDRLASGILEFDRGSATFTVATQLASYQRVTIHGTEGWIEVEIPFNPHPELPTRIHSRAGRDLDLTTVEFGPANQYTILVDQFTAVVRAHRPPPIPLADAVANLKVIDAVFASAARGGWVAC